ncbi:MAG: type II toxin-antitoxin system HicA family toxin [Dehalococcoidales bacterium]|nr:type II toxin-antitoxin system HicA family toxin [Dehalococcoidales bacterium]
MSPKLPRITAAELIRASAHDGWHPVRQSGSHVILRHPEKTGRVVVANHPRLILAPKTLESILDDASLTADQLRTLL